MNIRCPKCQTVFRVNPERIPATGARARCARCGATFMVRPPSPAAAAKPVSAPAQEAAPQPAPPPRPSPPPAGRVAGMAAGFAGTPEHQNGASSEGGADGPQPEPHHGSPLGARDPDARAKRLARALVSDIVAYHPDRRERSLAEGTLRTEFRDEILKSWEEYVAQVGDAVARSTPFFRDALNKILAQGQQVF